MEVLNGTIENSSFIVDLEVTPVHPTPRQIAVKLHKEELEKKQIFMKETHQTDWISSMLVVTKLGKIRTCLAQLTMDYNSVVDNDVNASMNRLVALLGSTNKKHAPIRKVTGKKKKSF